MQNFLFQTRRGLAALLLAVFVMTPGCDLFEPDNPVDPNGPSLDGILQDATLSQISNLAVGTEAQARIDLNIYFNDVSVVGREYWRFSNADPRLTGELLGKASSTLDNNTFYTTRPWAARYAAIRNACTMLQALDLTTADISDAEKAAARGFANTWIAYQLLQNSNLMFENGIRIDVCDPDVTAPLVTGRQASLDRLAQILDEANGDLGQNAGESFFFPTTVASDIDGFRQFNRALAARVDAYRRDWSGVLDALNGSFIDAGGDLEDGAYHIFSTGNGDITNPVFLDPQSSGEAIIVHPSFISDAEEGDSRVDEKTVLRVNDDGEPSPATLDDLTGSYGFAVYDSPVAPIPIIRNAELLLLRAEANIQLGNPALGDINRIRNAAGLGDYDGAEDQASLIEELLRQRRYELYGEGHRWIDVRRYNAGDCNTATLDGGGCLNDDLPIDRPEDTVWFQFPIPANENV